MSRSNALLAVGVLMMATAAFLMIEGDIFGKEDYTSSNSDSNSRNKHNNCVTQVQEVLARLLPFFFK